jgi:hypothetical protein
MAKLKQQQVNDQLLNDSRMRKMMVMYLDIIIRSLISFFCIGLVFSFVLIGYLHISWVFVLPLTFFVSILVSPFLSKLSIADKIIIYYENILKKLFKLQ